MRFELVETSFASAAQNMALDRSLLESLSANPRCILRFHRWEKPSVTHGYFSNPAQSLNLKALAKWGIDLARRPTGGGILFHTCDTAFAFLMPATHPLFSTNTLDNYALINGAVQKAVRQLLVQKGLTTLLQSESPPLDMASTHFCMAKPTQYDVMLDGYKIAGAAQRRTKAGLLHQGSLNFSLPSAPLLEEVLLPGTCVAKEMHKYTFCFPILNKEEIEQILEKELREIFY